jgi:hypothetical protein
MNSSGIITEKFPDELIAKLPPRKRLRGLPPEEVFGAFSAEEIRAYLKKLPKKAKSPKKQKKMPTL